MNAGGLQAESETPGGGSALGQGARAPPSESLVAPRFKSYLGEFLSDLKFQCFHFNANFHFVI